MIPGENIYVACEIKFDPYDDPNQIIPFIEWTKNNKDIPMEKILYRFFTFFSKKFAFRGVSKQEALVKETLYFEKISPNDFGLYICRIDVDDVVQNVIDIAKKVGKENEGLEIKTSLIRKIENIETTKKDKKPKVICLEWFDPFYICGHWVPQMVEMSGGINGISKPGERSHKIELPQITQFDPDILILLPCGFTLDRVISEYVSLRRNEDWNSLRAVKNDMVFAVDAMSYFSRPSPRVITGIEILAKIFNPKAFANLVVPENSYARLIKDV